MKSKDAKFIRTKWVDTQKGDDVRCRFVGQEIAAGDPRTDLFASTPPLFLARTVVSMAAWGADKTLVVDGARRLLRFSLRKGAPGDLHRAPRRGSAGSRREVRGRLKKALYGTRDAPQLWQKELGSTLKDLGFKDRSSSPRILLSPGPRHRPRIARRRSSNWRDVGRPCLCQTVH